jgi:hypothetical protein
MYWDVSKQNVNFIAKENMTAEKIYFICTTSNDKPCQGIQSNMLPLQESTKPMSYCPSKAEMRCQYLELTGSSWIR